MKKTDVRDELTNGGTLRGRTFPFIYFMVRYLAPVAIIAIFIANYL